MLRVAVLLAIAVACLADPPRPNIPNTFTSMLDVEIHDNRGTFFGDGLIDSDQDKKMRVENVTVKVGDVPEHYEDLILANMGEIYTVRSDGKSDPHCEVRKDNRTTLEEFWGWVATADYLGNRSVHRIDYDAWGTKIANVEIVVLVTKENPNVPKALNRRLSYFMINFVFKMFQAVEPPAEDFDIPPACKTPHRG